MCSTVRTDDRSPNRCPPPGRPVPLEVLERQITELASHLNAAMCQWLELVAEYDAREGWAQWGCRSCAHWVSWQCSIAPGAAREHVRVARRLAALPVLRAAFAEGRLSYSKLRALTRVENVEREDELLELAEHATAAQLERLVRGYRQVTAAERTALGEPPERWVRWDHADDGSLLLYGRLPAEEGELLITALEAAREQLAAECRGGAAGSDSAGPASDDDVSAETPHDVGRSVGEARADALLALADATLGRHQARRSGGDRHQVVVHVEVETLVTGPATGAPKRAACELASGIPLATETARRLACDTSVVRLLERDGRPLDIGRKTRSIPPALRRALEARDRGCRFPGCAATRFVDAHHIEHWAHGGATNLGNLVQLCRHHHRLLHEGGYSVTRTGGGSLLFRRPDGRPIAGCPAPPRGRAERLHSLSDRAPVIPPDACVPRWSGEPLDLELGVDALLTFAPLRPAARDRPPNATAGVSAETHAAPEGVAT
jgi:Domain of unknown function (DUF222)/HNH endonuclease